MWRRRHDRRRPVERNVIRKIVAIDPDPAKRESALAHGAALAFDPGAPDALKTINKACGFNVSG